MTKENWEKLRDLELQKEQAKEINAQLYAAVQDFVDFYDAWHKPSNPAALVGMVLTISRIFVERFGLNRLEIIGALNIASMSVHRDSPPMGPES